MKNANVLRLLDESTGDEIRRCAGPAPDGSCPRVAIGDVLPCAGHVIVLATGEGTIPYQVSRQATLCPVTIAASLAVAPDNLLTARQTEENGLRTSGCSALAATPPGG